MAGCGFDDVSIDAVGNVVGLYRGADRDAKRLLTGSHFDTVRNGGKYDGRLGIFVPMAAVRALHQAGRRLPFGIEVVAFAEEEGQRFPRPSSPPAPSSAPSTAPGSTAATPPAPRCARRCSRPAWTRRDRGARARPGALPRLRGGAHRAGSGAERARPAAGRRDVDQRQRALPLRGRRHGEPRRHHADGPAPRRRAVAAEVALLRRAARGIGAGRRGHRRHARGAERLDQRDSRALPLQPRPARHHRRGARRAGRRRAGRGEAHRRAPRHGVHRRGVDARAPRRRARPPGRSAGSAPSPSSACRCAACPAAPGTTR